MEFKPYKGPLSDIISSLNALNARLGASRNAYLRTKAEKDHFEATLVKSSPGDSNAEKTMNAKVTHEWLEFHKKLARAEAEYEFFKLQFKVLELEFQARYFDLKTDQSLIPKEE